MDNIIIEKIWEDIDFFEVTIKISSVHLQTSATVYVTESSIKELSQILRNFSQKGVTAKKGIILGRRTKRGRYILYLY